MKAKGCGSWIIGFAALLAVVFGLDFIGSRIDRLAFHGATTSRGNPRSPGHGLASSRPAAANV